MRWEIANGSPQMGEDGSGGGLAFAISAGPCKRSTCDDDADTCHEEEPGERTFR